MTKITKTKVIKRSIKGEVTSIKMMGAVVVNVSRKIKHVRYHKTYTTSKKYSAIVGKNKVVVGDKVMIEACRPISKTIRWRVIKKI